ncbi:MAG: PssE/Cps14G family polysaccharide biosynthesis glycosyltransferase [Anaerolineae bacterium]
MIFVTVGSTDFDALIEKMDHLALSLKEPVVMQIGLGSYKPKHSHFFSFAPSLDPYYEQADLIIAHGGLGTITEVLGRGKKLICVVNPATYDCHQEHLLSVFAAQNYLLWCKDLEHLEEAIHQARGTQFAHYQPPECHIHEVIVQYLNKLCL